MFEQVCMDVLYVVAVVATAVVLAAFVAVVLLLLEGSAAVVLAALVVVAELVWADANPIETVIAIAATTAIAMSE